MLFSSAAAKCCVIFNFLFILYVFHSFFKNCWFTAFTSYNFTFWNYDNPSLFMFCTYSQLDKTSNFVQSKSGRLIQLLEMSNKVILTALLVAMPRPSCCVTDGGIWYIALVSSEYRHYCITGCMQSEGSHGHHWTQPSRKKNSFYIIIIVADHVGYSAAGTRRTRSIVQFGRR